MTYTGNVTDPRAADLRELPGLALSKLAVGPYDNNAYLLRCAATGEQALIDAAAEPLRLLDLAGSGGLRAVVTTPRAPRPLAGPRRGRGGRPALWRTPPSHDAADIPARTDVELSDGDEVVVGDCRLRVIHLVATPGSIALVYDDPEGRPHLFTGDCLFPGGVGRTTTDEDFASLYSDVVTKLFDVLPDETWVYPGHGNDTTLGAERPHLEAWQARGW